MATDRLAIFPSRANLVMMKQRIVAANRGLNLLKRKRDALELKLRELTAELNKARADVDSIMQEAIFSMIKANFLNTDFKPAAVINADRADVFIRIRNNKVAGMLLPTFSLMMPPPTSLPHTGLGRGGPQVAVVREKFQSATKYLITLASLEFSVNTLMLGIRQTNMRINGLEYVVIPRFNNTVTYIRDELEEFEREDFYRLKRSQAKQRKAKENFTKLIRMRQMSREEEEAFKQHDPAAGRMRREVRSILDDETPLEAPVRQRRQRDDSSQDQRESQPRRSAREEEEDDY